MSSLKKTVEANHTAAVKGARLRGLLIEFFLQKKTDLSEQSKEFDLIRELFMKELAVLHDIDSKREKILIKYVSGWTLNDPAQFLEYAGCCTSDPDLNAEIVWEYSFRKDVLDVMLDGLDSRQPRENNTPTFRLKITPKVLMKIYRFFEAALTLRNDSNSNSTFKSTSKTLLTTRQYGQSFQYFLFKPHHNIIEFLKENNEIIDALIKFNLWDQRLNPNDQNPFYYVYTEVVKIDTRLNLIRSQLSKAFPNQIRDVKDMGILKTLGQMALTTSQELSIVLGELTSNAEINQLILTDYTYLQNLYPELYQPLIDICQLIKDAVNSLSKSMVFRGIRDSLNTDLFHDFATYLRRHPNYMSRIPFSSFCESLKNNRPSTTAALVEFLNNQALQYAPHGDARAGGDFNRGQAMEIHNAANQSVEATINGEPLKMSFNDAVIATIKASLNAICSYETTQIELIYIFQRLTEENNRPHIFNKPVYDWMFEEIKKGPDKENLAIVYSYLKVNYGED